MSRPNPNRPDMLIDLTRWNRAGLKKIAYIDGDAAVWLKRFGWRCSVFICVARRTLTTAPRNAGAICSCKRRRIGARPPIWRNMPPPWPGPALPPRCRRAPKAGASAICGF